MAELHHDEEEHHDAGHAGARGSASSGAAPGGEGAKKHKETLIVIAIGIVGLVLAYLTYRSRSSSSTTSTTVPTSVAGAGGNTGTFQSEITTLGQGLATLGNQTKQLQATLQAQNTANSAAQSGLAASIAALSTQLKAEMATSPQQAAAATSPAGPTVPQITIQGTNYDVLGLATDIKANVGGGAPVFFGNANAIAQGPSLDVPGNYAYTPSTYQSLVTVLPAGAPRENVTAGAK